MVRFLLLTLLLLVPAVAGAQAPTKGNPPPAAPEITREQAKQAADTLKDPQKRQALITTLEAIAAAKPAAAPPPTPAAAPTPAPSAPADAAPPVDAATLAPNSLGAEVLVGAEAFLTHLSAEAVVTLRAVHSVPSLWAWLTVMTTDPMARGILLDTLWRLALALAGGIATEWLIRWVTRTPALALVRLAPNGHAQPDEDGEARAERGEIEPPQRRRIAALTLLRRVPLVLARLVLELLPVIGFLVVSHLLTVTALGGEGLTRLALLAAIDAYALYVAILCLARMMFSPGEPRLRLLHISDGSAAYAMRWTRRIAGITVIGYAIAEAGFVLGLSVPAHDALLKAIGLFDHICLVIIVLQTRRAVRRRLRAPEGATGVVAKLRNRLARVWHWIAILLLAALWLVWAVEIPHGYTLMLRYAGVTLLVLIAARLLTIVAVGLLDRTLKVSPDTAARYPGLEARLATYHPLLLTGTRIVILFASVIALLQLWGLGTFQWLLLTTLGQRVLSSLVTMAVTVLLALLVWEGVNTAVDRHMAKLARESQLARSARLRTLLPLLRTTLLITILIVAGLMVLSEIGVNIAPLLAGAGIVGVAIGFGSQKLVQDLITGIFLLLENAMQVGDNVTVSGLSGTVENLSVRTIRLRAGDGSVHIIPFSAVTSVTNVNRGLGNASVSVTIAYGQDVDAACQALKDIAADMRQDANFSAKMLSDLQLWGVDKVDGAAVTIVGQVVCTDSGRWGVQREFNKRMSQRFQELEIALYNPLRSVEVNVLPPPEEPRHAEP